MLGQTTIAWESGLLVEVHDIEHSTVLLEWVLLLRGVLPLVWPYQLIVLVVFKVFFGLVFIDR